MHNDPCFISKISLISSFLLFVPDWLRAKGRNPNFEHETNEALEELLQKFYAEVRDKKGSTYMKSSYISIRYGINRYLRAPPFYIKCDITKDRDYMKSNQVFNGMLRKIKLNGKDITTHKAAISDEDWQKLSESDVLTTSTPQGLQKKVFMDIMLHFGRRGREGLCELRKDSFVIIEDENGTKYIEPAYNEMEKTKQGVDAREEGKQCVMTAAPGDSTCPIASFEKLISLLNPNCPYLFTRPKSQYTEHGPWYTCQKMGKNMIGNMMKRISEEAGLSQLYTNHCLRASTATILARSGLQDREIVKVTGHKNTDSVKHYVNAPTIGKQKAVSSLLHKKIPSTATGNSVAVMESSQPLSNVTNTASASTSSIGMSSNTLGPQFVSGSNFSNIENLHIYFK